MLIAIRNLLFQPLSFELNGDAECIHLCSRERKTIREDQISQEIRNAADCGIVSLTEIPGSTRSDPRVETATDEHAIEDVPAAKSRKWGQ